MSTENEELQDQESNKEQPANEESLAEIEVSEQQVGDEQESDKEQSDPTPEVKPFEQQYKDVQGSFTRATQENAELRTMLLNQQQQMLQQQQLKADPKEAEPTELERVKTEYPDDPFIHQLVENQIKTNKTLDNLIAQQNTEHTVKLAQELGSLGQEYSEMLNDPQKGQEFLNDINDRLPDGVDFTQLVNAVKAGAPLPAYISKNLVNKVKASIKLVSNGNKPEASSKVKQESDKRVQQRAGSIDPSAAYVNDQVNADRQSKPASSYQEALARGRETK